MAAIDYEEVKRIIEPIRDDLVYCVQGGWEDYFEIYANLLHLHGTSVRSRLIYDSTIRLARARFADRDDTRIIEDFNETLVVVLKETVSLKFKKHRQDGRTSNVRTKRNNAYVQQMEMDDMPHTVHLYCGYQTDLLFRKIESILLTCPSPYGNRWVHHLTNDEYMKSIIPMTAIQDADVSVTSPKLKIKEKEQNAAQA